jgi:hypothetical protein
MVRPAIIGQQREEGTGRHEAALAGRSCHSLAKIAPAVGIGQSRGGDWGKREMTGGSRPSATEARAGNGLASRAGVSRGWCRARSAMEKMTHDDFSILNSFSN